MWGWGSSALHLRACGQCGPLCKCCISPESGLTTKEPSGRFERRAWLGSHEERPGAEPGRIQEGCSEEELRVEQGPQEGTEGQQRPGRSPGLPTAPLAALGPAPHAAPALPPSARPGGGGGVPREARRWDAVKGR